MDPEPEWLVRSVADRVDRVLAARRLDRIDVLTPGGKERLREIRKDIDRYLTEDKNDGLFYRFIPTTPGWLAEGGHLQAMAFKDKPGADSTPTLPCMRAACFELFAPPGDMAKLKVCAEAISC